MTGHRMCPSDDFLDSQARTTWTIVEQTLRTHLTVCMCDNTALQHHSDSRDGRSRGRASRKQIEFESIIGQGCAAGYAQHFSTEGRTTVEMSH